MCGNQQHIDAVHRNTSVKNHPHMWTSLECFQDTLCCDAGDASGVISNTAVTPFHWLMYHWHSLYMITTVYSHNDKQWHTQQQTYTVVTMVTSQHKAWNVTLSAPPSIQPCFLKTPLYTPRPQPDKTRVSSDLNLAKPCCNNNCMVTFTSCSYLYTILPNTWPGFHNQSQLMNEHISSKCH